MISPLPCASMSPSVPSLGPAGAIAASSPSPTVVSTFPLIPIYAHAPSPPSIIETTGSAVKGLLVAVRDGSDLFLPSRPRSLASWQFGISGMWVNDLNYCLAHGFRSVLQRLRQNLRSLRTNWLHSKPSLTLIKTNLARSTKTCTFASLQLPSGSWGYLHWLS